jgi:hypothetical protein
MRPDQERSLKSKAYPRSIKKEETLNQSFTATFYSKGIISEAAYLF